jgi:hypothetical protein
LAKRTNLKARIENMKALLATLALGMTLVSGAFAQTKPTDPSAAHDSTGKANKIAAARDAAKAAKADLDKMKAEGKTPEEIQAAIADKKAAALLNLQKALDALNDLPDGAKDRTTKAKEVVSKRLEERKADAKNP